MKHCTGRCKQGRKPCRCGTPDYPSVPLSVEIGIVIFVVFAIAAAVASI